MITTIFVIGAGYVGLSNAVLLAQPKLANQVTLVDIDAQKIAQLQQQESPIDDALIAQFLSPRADAIPHRWKPVSKPYALTTYKCRL